MKNTCRLASVLLFTFLSPLGLPGQEPVKVTETVVRKAAISKVDPVYPAFAKQSRIFGKATVEIEIDENGAVGGTRPVSGSPVLTAAVVMAVKQWKFKPFEVGGKPVKTKADLTFEFTL